MNLPTSRRHFLKSTATTGALLGLGDLSFLSQLPGVSRADAQLNPKSVRFQPEIEPLVRLLEETPRERLLEEVAARIKRGLNYRELLAALLLAGVRNIQPRPVGFKFHAVLVVNSAHLASLASPDSDRWLPIFWSLDHFKESQARDVREGDWTMGPVKESAVPPSSRARQAFIEAMDNWDEAAADAAVVGLARTARRYNWLMAIALTESLNNVVWIDPNGQNGEPYFYGTRVAVKVLFDYLKGMRTLEEASLYLVSHERRAAGDFPIKETFFHLPSGGFAIGRSVDWGMDSLGRAGNYLTHHLVLSRDGLLMIGADPVTLIDTGPLVALVDKGDKETHKNCTAIFRSLKTPPLTTWPCFTEALYFLGGIRGWDSQTRLWRFVERGAIFLHTPGV